MTSDAGRSDDIIYKLAGALQASLALIGHTGFHGLKIYNSPSAATVERDMMEFAEKHCPACKALLKLEREKIILIRPNGSVEAN